MKLSFRFHYYIFLTWYTTFDPIDETENKWCRRSSTTIWVHLKGSNSDEEKWKLNINWVKYSFLFRHCRCLDYRFVGPGQASTVNTDVYTIAFQVWWLGSNDAIYSIYQLANLQQYLKSVPNWVNKVINNAYKNPIIYSSINRNKKPNLVKIQHPSPIFQFYFF